MGCEMYLFICRDSYCEFQKDSVIQGYFARFEERGKLTKGEESKIKTKACHTFNEHMENNNKSHMIYNDTS